VCILAGIAAGVVFTLLCMADHHQLLAGVSGAVHGDQQLPDVLLDLVLRLGDEHRRL